MARPSPAAEANRAQVVKPQAPQSQGRPLGPVAFADLAARLRRQAFQGFYVDAVVEKAWEEPKPPS